MDGKKGVLRYRGIPIEQLAENSRFVETAYLLIHGELPTAHELASFSGPPERSLTGPRRHAGLLRKLSPARASHGYSVIHG